MLSLLPWDYRHVRWFPCEDIPVLPEEGGECAFLRRVEAGPDHSGLVRLIVLEDDGLRRHGWLELRLESRLLGEDLLLDRQEVLCCLGNKNRVPGSFQGVGELDVLGHTRIGGLQISVDREDPFGAGIFRRRYMWLGIAMNLAREGLPRMAW